MKNRNKKLIIFGAVLLVVAIIVMLSTMFSTGEIRPEYFSSPSAIASYILIIFAVGTVGYVLISDWINKL